MECYSRDRELMSLMEHSISVTTIQYQHYYGSKLWDCMGKMVNCKGGVTQVLITVANPNATNPSPNLTNLILPT